MTDLTENQREALSRFAKKHGRQWKSKLHECWMSGRYPYDIVNTNDSAYLQQVRNQFGPSWLVKYRIDK